MIRNWADMQKLVYSDDYHCEHFAVDALRFLTGKDISQYMYTGSAAIPMNVRQFKKVTSPSQFSLVLLRDNHKAHIGIWYNNAVLHLSNDGVVHQTLNIALRGFKRVSFYEVDDGRF